jgi:NitT/TauT family transport system ATP-binding protein
VRGNRYIVPKMRSPTPAVKSMQQTGEQAANRPQIEIREVSKTYPNGTYVLDRIRLNVYPSEFVSIIGPSGCGKSTLLKLIAGLSPISSGKISIDGMEPVNAREIMAFMFQDATLLPWRTVQRNVELSLELHAESRARRKEKATSALALVGLTDVAGQYPRQLSGGMKMRVSIARALSGRPKVFLMDEPFAALDEMTRDRLNEELLRLRAENRWTALFVTHSVAEAVFLSDRIIVLATHPGRIAHEIPIRFDVPRNADLRLCAEYEQTVLEVSHKLRSVFQQP